MTYSARQLVLGIDGGGTKTVAWLADASQFKSDDEALDDAKWLPRLGCGSSGPSNCRSVGLKTATTNLRKAIDEAFADAGREVSPVASVCFGLAGADRDIERDWIEQWANKEDVGKTIHVCNDAVPLLYATTIAGPAVALISGTGSLAVGRGRAGELVRCGGWGGLIGDEGSGYRIAIDGLRAAARHSDGRGPRTKLHDALLRRLEREDFSEIIPILYNDSFTRRDIAGLATLVFSVAANGDETAEGIIDQAADDLAHLIVTLVKRIDALDREVPIGMAGGVLMHQTSFVESIARRLIEAGLNQTRMERIEQPVQGAVRLAAQRMP